MTLTYGLTPQGWVSKPLDQIMTELDEGLQEILGASAGTEPDGTIPMQSGAGQLKALMADRDSALWDGFQLVASMVDPSQATGTAQDAVCSITGTKRDPAEFSTTPITCTGVPNTPLQVGRVVTVTTSGSRFDSQPAISQSDPNYPSSTLAALPAWATNTTYALGARVTANGNAYQCSQAGESAAAGPGPAGTTLGLDIVDNGAIWRFLGVGTGAVDVTFIAEAAGPVGALANTLINIATPVSGWQGATNFVDAVPGALKETDAALRRRRDAELALAGNTTALAILARVSAVNQGSTDPNHAPPTSVKVLANDTDSTDANGLPPHSVEAIVQGGTVLDIAQAIWAAKGAGTNLYSGTGHSTVIVDAKGNTQTVAWTIPTNIPIYVVATVFYDPTKWTQANAAELVEAYAKSSLLTFGDGYPPGQSVRALPLGAAILDEPGQIDDTGAPVVPAPAGSSPLPGGVDVSPIYIGTAPDPVTSTTIAIGVRQVAQFSSGQLTFTATAEAP